MDKFQCTVVGAGVVGLAIAKTLAEEGLEVLLLEAEDSFGTHTSSRNSEVIHAGIYYPTGSLKARFCVEGKRKLYEYCADRNIPHKNLGKLIVATDETEVSSVKNYLDKAKANGVTDLYWLNQSEVAKLEPAVQSVGAVYSPSTGIIDSHTLMQTLLGDAENAGTITAYRTPLENATVRSDGFELKIGGMEPIKFRTDYLINCGGLRATEIAQSITGLDKRHIPSTYYAKAHYYSLPGSRPFSHLIYPVAHKNYLGVHVTLDMAGDVRFGPDLEWIDGIDYSFDESREIKFYEAIKRYWPELKEGQLQPGYTGVRPKISGPTEVAADFKIDGPRTHGIPGLVNLFGIESPGLTSSLAIAEHVGSLLRS